MVARPLGAAVTIDPRFRTILVTELQFLVVSAARTQGNVATSGVLSTTARYLILREPSLSYDFSGFLTHTENPGLVTYAVVNGLSLARPLEPRRRWRRGWSGPTPTRASAVRPVTASAWR